MNLFDVLLLSLAAVLIVAGLLKGLVRILVGIAALVAAFALASRFHPALAEQLSGTGFGIEARRLLGYLGIFFGTLLAGAVLAFLLRKLVKAALLGWADRLGGAALGFLAATLAAALIVLPLVAYLPRGESMISRSTLAPYVTVVADFATVAVPRELKDRYRERVDQLRSTWRERLQPGEERADRG